MKVTVILSVINGLDTALSHSLHEKSLDVDQLAYSQITAATGVSWCTNIQISQPFTCLAGIEVPHGHPEMCTVSSKAVTMYNHLL